MQDNISKTRNYSLFSGDYEKFRENSLSFARKWAYLLFSIFLDGRKNGKRRDAIKVGRFIFDSAKKD